MLTIYKILFREVYSFAHLQYIVFRKHNDV